MQHSLDSDSPHPRMLFVVNPTSGKGQTRIMWANIRRSLTLRGVVFSEYMTSAVGDGERYVRNVSPRRYNTIISVGGDGTLNEVVNGLALRWLEDEGQDRIPITLGVLPTGSGNDFARTLEMPKRIEQCLGCVLGSTVRRVDLGKVSHRYFINVSGAGFDAEVVDRFNRGIAGSKSIGKLGYLLSVLTTLISFPAQDVELRLDGRSVRDNILLIAVGNGRYYGGGMKITPGADVSDGRFDVCWVQGMPRLDFVASLASVFRGAHLSHPRVRLERASCVEVVGSSNVRVQVDGEVFTTLPATWNIIPSPITLLVPTGAQPCSPC